MSKDKKKLIIKFNTPDLIFNISPEEIVNDLFNKSKKNGGNNNK